MRPTLFDVLEGRTLDRGSAPGAVLDPQGLVESISVNLNRLLNARRESVPHLPDYGLPDASTILRDSPDSVEMLRTAIRETVELYEPRIRRARVRVQEIDPVRMRLVFDVVGEVGKGERVRFEAVFGSQESTTVRPT